VHVLIPIEQPNLKLEDVLVPVPELSKSTLDLSLLHTILRSTNGSVLTGTEGWMGRGISIELLCSGRVENSRSTDEEFGISLLVVISWQILGDHLLGDKTLLAWR
jgi:hypothetical protein